MKFFIKSHKWIGIFASLFIIVFSISGIFLNHRQAISSLDVSRSILPETYSYTNWNNSAIKGTFRLSPDSILVYGGSGIWLTDSLHSEFYDFTAGIYKGADNKNTVNIVKTKANDIFAISTFDLYQLETESNKWINLTSVLGTDERLSDITTRGDSLLVMTRSHVYVSTLPYTSFEQIELQAPIGYKNEISAFRAMWTLHSGEMYGLIGKLWVDFIGVVFIILSITGIILMIFPKLIKRVKDRSKKKKYVNIQKSNYKWHNKLGAWFLLGGIIVILSGIFLRPPAMIFIIRDKIKPLPYSVQDTPNPWFDKLRNIRYDNHAKEWLMYTSSGFYVMDELNSLPQQETKAPQVSVMGVNVLEEFSPSLWIVGSFSGLYYWDRGHNMSVDVTQMRPLHKDGVRVNGALVEEQRNVIGSVDVSGYTNDFPSKEIVFSYSHGALSIGKPEEFAKMPEEIKKTPMSLWHVSLEAHVGRIYTPIVGSLLGESMFILISGVLMLVIYITGYIVYRRKWKRKK